MDSSSSYLGIRCGGSILKSSIESSSSSCTCLHFQNHQHLKFNQQQQKQKRIICSTSINDYNGRRVVVSNCSASTTFTTYLDTVFGTEMKKKKNQHIQDNTATEVVREIKVGLYGDSLNDKLKKQGHGSLSSKLKGTTGVRRISKGGKSFHWR